MKKLIGPIAGIVLTVWTSSLFANSEAIASAQSAPSLTWNRIALEAAERAKPGQHQAFRLLAYVSLAQHAALHVRGPDTVNDVVGLASARVIAELLPSQAALVEQRYRELHPNARGRGAAVAHRVRALARKDGFARPWEGQAPAGGVRLAQLGQSAGAAVVPGDQQHAHVLPRFG